MEEFSGRNAGQGHEEIERDVSWVNRDGMAKGRLDCNNGTVLCYDTTVPSYLIQIEYQ